MGFRSRCGFPRVEDGVRRLQMIRRMFDSIKKYHLPLSIFSTELVGRLLSQDPFGGYAKLIQPFWIGSLRLSINNESDACGIRNALLEPDSTIKGGIQTVSSLRGNDKVGPLKVGPAKDHPSYASERLVLILGLSRSRSNTRDTPIFRGKT